MFMRSVRRWRICSSCASRACFALMLMLLGCGCRDEVTTLIRQGAFDVIETAVDGSVDAITNNIEGGLQDLQSGSSTP